MDNTSIMTARQLKTPRTPYTEPPDKPSSVTPAKQFAENAPRSAPTLRDFPGQAEGSEENAKSPVCVSPPRYSERRASRQRGSRVPFFQLVAALAGTAGGVFFTLSAPDGTDFTGSLLCAGGDFAGLLIKRLLWGGAFLLAEYLCGYFALGWLFVWAAPLVCGLGTGAALAGAFANGTNAVPMIFTAAGMVFAVVMGAGTSRLMSCQLLNLISSGKNTIVSASPAAGEYTLRFLIWFAVLAGCAIAEAAIRTLVPLT